MSAHYTSATNRIGPLSLIWAAIPLFGGSYFLFARLKAMLETEVRWGRKLRSDGGGVGVGWRWWGFLLRTCRCSRLQYAPWIKGRSICYYSFISKATGLNVAGSPKMWTPSGLLAGEQNWEKCICFKHWGSIILRDFISFLHQIYFPLG